MGTAWELIGNTHFLTHSLPEPLNQSPGVDPGNFFNKISG